MTERLLRVGEIWCECGWPRYVIERCRNEECAIARIEARSDAATKIGAAEGESRKKLQRKSA